ncbi:MAG TPA: hypothetical protein V6C85_35515, partial [Allocoleopsis sp.]
MLTKLLLQQSANSNGVRLVRLLIFGSLSALANTVSVSTKAVGATINTPQFRCIQASALNSATTVQPPPPPVTSETRSNLVVERLNPVCPKGQLPQPLETFAPKGKPVFNQKLPQSNN